MNIKTFVTLILLLGAIWNSNAQIISPVVLDSADADKDGWKGSRLVSMTPYDSLYDVVFVKDHTTMEYAESSTFKGERLNFSTLFLWTTVHRRIKLNNDQGVNDYNKMYLPVLSNEEIVEIRARAVNPDGSVINFNKANIKDIEDLDGYGAYKIFAFEGVQLGSEIEYYYTIKSVQSEYYGSNDVQKSAPILDYKFEIVCPLEYSFECKLYNGQDSAILDTLIPSRKRLQLKKQFVEAFQREEFSLSDALKQRIEYRLASCEFGGKDVGTWQKAADWYAKTIHSTYDTKLRRLEKKTIKKLLKKLKINDSMSTIEKLVTVENYLKREVNLEKYSKELYVYDILDKKEYSKFSSVRLFALVLRYLGVEHELVLTSNRFEKAFDGDFESYVFLNNLFLYLPVEKLYINPASEIHRIGTVPFGLTNQNGLFIKPLLIGDYVSAFPDVKFISDEGHTANTSNLDIQVRLFDGLKVAEAEITRSTTGHCSTTIQPYLPYLSKERRQEVLEDFFVDLSFDAEVKDLATDNEVISGSQLNKPFVVSATVKMNSLIEKAGNKYLFHLGKLLGEQSELYVEKERQFDLISNYNRKYIRKIKFEVPAGYRVLNKANFTMNEVLLIDGKNAAQFICNSHINEGSFYVDIDESYSQIEIDKKYYSLYRKVINAAADFNKKVLILEKEE
jgi:hypothetical protein